MLGQSTSADPVNDLIGEVGSKIEVAVDRWSAGQVGFSDLVVAFGVFAVAVGAAWILRRLVARWTRGWEGASSTAATILGRLVSSGMYIFAAAIVLEVLGFSVGPVLIIALLVLIVVLLLRPLVQNLSSGLLLQLRSPFSVGDLVETNDNLGVVEQVNTRTVVLITGDGRTVHVPNDDVLAGPLVNYSVLGRRRSELAIRLGSEADVEPAIRAIGEAVGAQASVLDEPSPEIVITGIDGAQICLEVLFWHGPGLESERAARNSVSRAVLEALAAQRVRLTDPSFAVALTGPEPSDHRAEPTEG